MSWKNVVGYKYKKFHDEEYCNTIFSNEAIEMGKEENNIISDRFSKPDKVYCRCYFAKPIGTVTGKNFYHELWIDGKLVKTTYFAKPPDPDWDQIQIWISEDEYKNELASLKSGEHEILIWVIKNEYNSIKEEWKKKRLSVGKITYIIPQGMGGSGLSNVSSDVDLSAYVKMPEDITSKSDADTVLKEILSKVNEIKSDTELIIEYTSQIEAIFDKQEDLEVFLKDKLQSDFDKMKDSWQDYKAGNIGKKELIKQGIKSIGKTFIKKMFDKIIPV